MPKPWEKYGQAEPTKKPKPWETYGQAAAATEAPQRPEPTQRTEAALEGFGEASTFGYLPQLQAAAGKVLQPVFSAMTGKDIGPVDYEAEKAHFEGRQEQLQEKHPGYYTGGQVAGFIAPGMAAGKVAKGLIKGG